MSSSVVAFHKMPRMASLKRTFTIGKIIYTKSTSSAPISGNVPGLSPAVVKVPAEPVGPGASKNTGYKNPEYFSYDRNSYYEAEVEMLQYRCPQPSTKQYYKHTQ